MNISDWQHEQNRNEIRRLEELGFRFTISSTGYMVWFKNEFVHGAGIRPGTKPKHWRHARADLRDYLAAAVREAKRSKFYAETES